MGILAMHVHDIFFCGNDLFQKNVITELKKIFKAGMHEIGTYKFLVLGASSISPIDIKKGRSLRKNYELNQEERQN